MPADSASSTLELIPVPAFQDNYLWLLRREEEAVVVDPGDAAPIEQALSERGLRLVAILVTHHHPDHIGGIADLLRHRAIPVHGPRLEHAKIRTLDHLHAGGDVVELLGRRFEVIDVPGHTLGHIAYFAAAQGDAPPVLLCGDTLFSGGCGRLFEGTAEQMHRSLSRLAGLPPQTKVCCAHEYTNSNLAFALAVEPGNADLQEYAQRVRDLRAAQRPTLPSSVGLEVRVNPFLRAAAAEIRRSASAQAGRPVESDVDCFAVLRKWKDGFRAPATAAPN